MTFDEWWDSLTEFDQVHTDYYDALTGWEAHKIFGISNTEFCEGQWWLVELDKMVENGTCEQRRAVAVVRKMLNVMNGK